MYMLILLMIISEALTINIFVFKLSITTIIFARNPNLGGIPPRLIIAVKYENFLYCSIASISMVFMFELNSRVIIIITDLQYKIENISIVFNLMMILSNIQLKLKIEEYLIISVMAFLFICIMVPIQAVMIMNTKISNFHWKTTK